MAFSTIVDSVITPGSVTVSRQGYGTPMLVYKHNKRPGLMLQVASAAELVTDYGFSRTVDRALFQKVDQIFAQDPKPAILKISRRQSSLTPIVKLTVPATGLVPNQVVSVLVNGTLATFTGDATPTDAELATGLAAAINAIVPGIAGAALGVVTITSPADLPVLLEAWSTQLAYNDNTTAGAVATDLDAIFAEDPDFFGFDFVHTPDAEAAAVSTWAAAHERMFFPTWNESAIQDGASTTDVGYTLKAADYGWTASHATRRRNHDALGIALFATLGATFNPGQETFAHKGLQGTAPDVWTSSEVAAMEGKNVNFYQAYLKLGTTFPGKVAGGPLVYIDVVRGLAWLNMELKATGFEAVRGAVGKVGYTDAGAAYVAGFLQSVLNRATSPDNPVLRNVPAPTITFPKVADMPDASRAVRAFGPYSWSGQLQGAIHTITIRGVVTV